MVVEIDAQAMLALTDTGEVYVGAAVYPPRSCSEGRRGDGEAGPDVRGRRTGP